MIDYCVLGSSSFSATHFIKDKLIQGNKVIAISRSKSSLLNKIITRNSYKKENLKNFKYHLIKDNQKIIECIHKHKPKYIIDFAGQGMVAESWTKPSLWFETNLISKIKIYESLLGQKWIKKIIKISTPEVYGSSDKKIREDSHFNPSTPYAVSHASIDFYLNINQKFRNLPVIFARFANFYGEGQQSYRIIPKVILSIIFKKKFFLHGGGSSIRSFIHVTDVSNAINCCIKRGKIGSTYHFSTNEQISIYELSKKIILMNDKKFKDYCVIKKIDRLGKDFRYNMNFNKTKKELSWTPTINLFEGLSNTIYWFNAHKDDYKDINWNFKLKK